MTKAFCKILVISYMEKDVDKKYNILIKNKKLDGCTTSEDV